MKTLKTTLLTTTLAALLSGAAWAAPAVYTVDSGTIVLTGNVLLTQGQAAIRGGELTVDLRSGTGRMSGGVTTTFVPASGGN